MLIPLTRKKFEELIPPVGTGEQYRYCWGKPRDFLQRLLISVVAIVVAVFVELILGESFAIITFALGLFAGLYWLWEPAVRKAAQRHPAAEKNLLQGRLIPQKQILRPEKLLMEEKR